MKTICLLGLIAFCLVYVPAGWAASHQESEKSSITEEQQQALDQLIESLKVLRSNPESMKLVEEWFEEEVEKSKEELARIDEEIESVKKQLEKLTAQKKELETKFKTLESGRKLISRLSRTPLPEEPAEDTALPPKEKPEEPVEKKQDTANAQTIFAKEIVPIIENNCIACHGDTEPGGNLKLTSREDILKGGNVGKVIVPGNPEQSVLYQMVIHEAEPYMPLGADMLVKEDIQKIAEWIRAEG